MSDPLARHRSIYQKFRGYTMIDERQFLSNLIIAEGHAQVPGCIVECGTWRGGMIAGIADLLGPERSYVLFDSFEGLPPAQEIDGPLAVAWQADKESPTYLDNCAADISVAEEAMSMSAARDVRIVKGWFDQTLPMFRAPGKIAVLRLDGDWYESTMTCLTCLFPQLAPGGIVIVDDYYQWDGCARAVHDYLSGCKSTARIIQFNGIAAIQPRD